VAQNRTHALQRFKGRIKKRSEGQSLIEVALMVPIVTVLVCYAVDFGFFLLAATSLTSAARNAIEYSIQGTASPAQSAEPSANSIFNLAIISIGLPGALASTVSVQICANSIGLNILINAPQCITPSTGGGAISNSTPDLDPETPIFQLNRVDLVYTFSPPIPVPAFPSTTFHRSVEMRAIQ
jgi:CBS domain containing-hemolysin-like protein